MKTYIVPSYSLLTITHDGNPNFDYGYLEMSSLVRSWLVKNGFPTVDSDLAQ